MTKMTGESKDIVAERLEQLKALVLEAFAAGNDFAAARREQRRILSDYRSWEGLSLLIKWNDKVE